MEKGKIIIKRMIIGFMTVVMTFAGMNITPVQAAAKVELGKKIIILIESLHLTDIRYGAVIPIISWQTMKQHFACSRAFC